jgi:3-hydroxyisobutyrate dehydrogenase
MSNVAFIGLGVMGYPMAGYISKAGHNVTVYNRTGAKADKWLSEYKGSKATTPSEAADGADFIFTCVGNDKDLKEVTFGDSCSNSLNGIFKTIKKGAVYIDNTTASATIARDIYDFSIKNEFGFLDAPVSGGQAGAENGALTVMIGGDLVNFNKAKDIINCYSKKMKLLGAAGSGQLAKMVNQICIAGLVQGLSEAINFGKKAGLNMENVIEVISKGAAQSWQMENRYKTMIDNKFDFGFAVDWMRKDLKIALDEAKKNGSLLPVTEIVDQYYEDVQKMGGNRWDTSSLIKRLSK